MKLKSDCVCVFRCVFVLLLKYIFWAVFLIFCVFSLLLNIASLKLRIKHVTEEQLRHFVIYSAFKKKQKLFGSGNGCSFQGSKCLGKEPRMFGSEFNCSVQSQAR